MTRASLEKILRGILEAEVVVADMTGRNANVFYEVGIAHATKENVVLLAQSIRDDLPFDLQHIDHLEYDLTVDGLAFLTDRLSEIIERLPPEPQGSVTPFVEGALRVRAGLEPHKLYRVDRMPPYLLLHLLVINEGTRTLTLIEPSVKFDDPAIRARFWFLRPSRVGGGRAIVMIKGRAMPICAGFKISTRSSLEPGQMVSGVLSVKVAESGFEPYRFRFKVMFRSK